MYYFSLRLGSDREIRTQRKLKKNASTQPAGVGEMQLVIDVRSCQCHLSLKHSQFKKNKSLRFDSSRCSSDGCTLGQYREREIVTGEIKLLLDDAFLAFDF